MTIQRYNPPSAEQFYDTESPRMRRHRAGRYVRHTDHIMRCEILAEEREALLEALRGELLGKSLRWWAELQGHFVKCRYCGQYGRVRYAVKHAPGCLAAKAEEMLDAFRRDPPAPRP